MAKIGGSRWAALKAIRSRAAISQVMVTTLQSNVAQDEEPNAQVEDILRLHHLEELLRMFREHKPRPPSSGRPTKTTTHSPGKLDIREFKTTMVEVLGTHKYDGQLENLFNKLDISHDNFVDWNEFTTYVLQQLREKDFLTARKFRPFRGEPKIRHVVHNRQETTSKIVFIDSPFKYITVGREGAVSVWTSGLYLETHFEVCQDPDAGRNQKRRVKMWVNDAVYMPNCRKLAVITTGRDIHFYEVTSGQYNKEVLLYGLEDVPCCLDFWYDKKNPSGRCRLFVGDDEGSIHSYNFHQPLISLFNPSKKNTGPQRIYFPDLRRHSNYVEHTTLERVHTDMVRQVCYLPENGYLLSASTSTHHSLSLLDELGKKRTYVFNVTKGVECFAYSKALNVLVTGSSDHLVRVWNPYVTSRPVALLSGHAVGVVDVAIHEPLSLILSYSKDAVLKVWDPSEHTCLQTVGLKFPCAVHGPLLEHGPFSLCLPPSSRAHPGVLLVAAQDYLAHLRLSSSGPDTSQLATTHQVQLCAAVFNPYYKQVVTGADDSSIGVWDIETGRKAMMLTDCHGQEEITSLGFDLKYQRLITGARDGSIKVWSAQTGQCMQQLEAVAEAEVTGVVPLTDRPALVSVGWSRQITTYDDSNPENSPVRGDTWWPGGQLHQDDILSVAYLSPLLLATGSYDGAIYVWSMEKCQLLVQLKAPENRSSTRAKKGRKPSYPSSQVNLQPVPTHHPHNSHLNSRPNSRPNSHHNSRPNSRPNSRHRQDHRTPNGTPAPVDALLFLSSRGRQTEGALLVSTSGGNIRFWSIQNKRHFQGSFYAPESPDESVLAICTDPSNSVLVTGDTSGQLTVWDISDYCLHPHQQTVRSLPPILQRWQAHEGAIVSTEHIPGKSCESDHDLLLTASTDHLAKLWTSTGRCIGVFGQKQAWNLHSPQTWVDKPPTEKPITILQSILANGPSLGGGGGEEVTDPGDDTSPRVIKDSPRVGSLEEPLSSLQLGERLLQQSAGPNELQVPLALSCSQPESSPRLLANMPKSKTSLGRRVEQEFERRRSHRQKRRAANTNDNKPATPRPGDPAPCGRPSLTAFPFHSLDMKPLDDFVLPEPLPGRSLTSLHVTSQKPPTKPPAGTPANSLSQGSRDKMESVAGTLSSPASTSDLSLPRLPDIRKNHTTIGVSAQAQDVTSIVSGGQRSVSSARV